VAQRSGFGSTDALNRVFRKRLGMTPAEFRGSFG
jgi:AraC-like DNA-binding protein